MKPFLQILVDANSPQNSNLKTPPGSPTKNPISPTKLISPAKIASWKVRKIDGRFNLTPPPSVREILDENGNISWIYRIKNRRSNQRYYGSSVNILSRVGSYSSRVNNEALKHMHIENVIRKHYRDIHIAIVEEVDDISEEQLHELEERWQDEYQTRNPKYGYNHSRPTQERLRCCPRKRKKLNIQANPSKKHTSQPVRAAFKKAMQALDQLNSSKSNLDSDLEGLS